MKYEDYKDPATGETWVNGKYVGVRQGSNLGDALNPTDDGYDHIRSMEHQGTITPDVYQKVQPKE